MGAKLPNILKDIADDFKVYSKAHPGRLNKWISPFLMLGLYVALSYRIRRLLFRMTPIGVLLSKILGLITNILTSCYISPKAAIGGGLYLPHPVGVVIGDGVSIGKRASIYQNVTFGSRASGAKAYPVVGNRVTVFANSVVVGAITIADDVVIGAGSIVLKDAPAGARVAGNPAKVLGQKPPEPTIDVSKLG